MESPDTTEPITRRRALQIGTAAITLAVKEALAHNNPEDVARETVDLMELNHFYDQQGRLEFDQVIFYDWCDNTNRHQVLAWRLVKNPNQLPKRDWRNGGYIAIWHDGDKLRHIQSQHFRETWTQYDPELAEREYLPKEKRRELR